jgi:hypothetical protein
MIGLVAAATLSVACADAQEIPRSQRGSVTQDVAGTRIEIVYRRPVARGRELFGALVPWRRIWTPSADSSAQLRISRATEINGRSLPAGNYGIWTIPDSTEWTVVFSRVPSAFHLRYPEGQDALRVRAVPQRGEHVETLQFSFPLVDADSAVLQLRWGSTVVPLSIRTRGR